MNCSMFNSSVPSRVLGLCLRFFSLAAAAAARTAAWFFVHSRSASRRADHPLMPSRGAIGASLATLEEARKERRQTLSSHSFSDSLATERASKAVRKYMTKRTPQRIGFLYGTG